MQDVTERLRSDFNNAMQDVTERLRSDFNGAMQDVTERLRSAVFQEGKLHYKFYILHVL